MKIDKSIKNNTQLIKDFYERFTEERNGHHVVKEHPLYITQWLRAAFRRVEERNAE